MSADKSIKFQFALDENSFNRVKTAMDTLIRQAQTLANTLKSIQLPGAGQSGGSSAPSGGTGMLGGGSVGSAGARPQTQLGKVVMDNAGAFANMSKLGDNAIKGLTASLRLGVREQEKEVERLERVLNRLGNKYSQLQAEGRGSDPYSVGILRKMTGVAGQYSSAQQGLNQLQGMQMQQHLAGVPTLPGTINMPAGGAASPVNSAAQVAAKSSMGLLTPIGPGNLNAQSIMGMLMGNGAGAVALRSAGLVASGAKAIASTSFAVNNMEMDTRADRGNAIRARYERVRRGDVSDALAESFLAKRLSREDASSYLQSALAGDVSAIDTMKGLGSEFIRGNVSLKSLTDRARDTMGAERYQAMLDKIKQDAEYYTKYQRGYDYLNETRAERATTFGILGRGFNRDPKTGELVDTFTNFDIAQRKVGSSAAAYSQYYATARAQGGAQFARDFAGTIGGAERAGFSGFGSAFEQLARGGGSKEQIRQTMGYTLGTGAATPTAMGLAGMIGGFDPSGTLSQGGMQSLLSVFQNGFNPTGAVTDQNQLARFGLGMQSLSNPLDGYGLGMRTIAAIQATPGASTYTQDALAKMDTKQLLAAASGQGSEFMADMGVTPDAARKMVASQFDSVFSRAVDQNTNEPYMKVLRKYREATASGQDPFEFMASLSGDEARQLGVAYSALGGTGGFEAGLGAINIGRGIAGKKALKFKGTPFGTIDKLTQEQVDAENEQQKTSAAALAEVSKELKTAFANNGNIGKTLTAFGTFGAVLDEVTSKLARLGGVSEEIVNKAGDSILKKVLMQAANDVEKAKAKTGIDLIEKRGLTGAIVERTMEALKE